MTSVTVGWKFPARDGNTCYRPDGGSSQLQEVFEGATEDLDRNVDIALEETLLTASDQKNYCELLIEERKISDWIETMDSRDIDWWESKGRPALKSRQFSSLMEEDFLPNLLTFVLDQLGL